MKDAYLNIIHICLKVIGFIHLLYIFICSYPLYGLSPNKPIHQNMQTTWSSKQGLPSDNITDVLQDKRGFIWIGTFNGLVKFDGVHFEIFTHKTRKDFKSNSATKLFEDSKGRMWIGTNGNGLAKYKDNKFTMYTIEKGLLSNYINAICEDNYGMIWIGTRKGLVYLDQSGKISVPSINGLKNNLVTMIYKDLNGKMLFAFEKSGLYELSPEGIIKSVYNNPMKKHIVLSILMEKKDKIWFGTRDNGLYVLEKGSLKHFPILDNIRVKTINNIKLGKLGSIWICSDSGLFRFYEGKYTSYTEKNGLSNNQTVGLYEDKEGNAWIATSRGGLIKLSESKFYTISTRHGLAHDTVNAIMRAKNGDYWIGTDRGISIYNDGNFLDNPLLEKLSKIRIRHIIQDSTGKIWLCTYSKLGVVTYFKGSIKTYSKDDGLSSNRCRFALEDKDGRIWIGTANGLNSIMDGKIRTYLKKDGLEDTYILSLFNDSKNNMWVGTNGGGASVLKKEKFTSYSKKDGLASDLVFSIFEDSKNNLWFTTNNGLSRYRNGTFINYSVKDGLIGNAVFQILEDPTGKFWMTADIGIFTADINDMDAFANRKLDKVNMTLYNSSDGLIGSSTPVSWGIQTSDSQIWFPTLKGIAIVDTVSLSTNMHKPPVFITSINVDNKKYSSKKPLILKPDYKRINIDFTALSFVVPEKVKFKYLLEGFDDDWSKTTSRRSASYTTLPPGNYTFKVIAVNNDGIWNMESAQIKIIQKPYSYQTIWFTLLLVLVFFILVFIVFFLRIRSLRQSELKLEKLIIERTKELVNSKSELEKANKILNRISITDSLTGLPNRRKFDAYLSSEWKRSIRLQKPISIILIDIDFFKTYNDEYGHQAGDNCLQKIASALSNSIKRSSDLMARYGGEEFVAILPESDKNAAITVAERIKKNVENLKLKHEKSSVAAFVTVSSGTSTTIPGHKDLCETLLKKSDTALYRSKSDGRNRVSSN